MIHRGFRNPQESHQHSLKTLDLLYEFDDFMLSIGTLADMGCGTGMDLAWWASRTTRGDNPVPLNIQCTGVDTAPRLAVAEQTRNIQYKSQNFEDPILLHKTKYDIIWCHDAFQYVLNPFETLRSWRSVVSDSGMLIVAIPQTTIMEFNDQEYDQPDFHYYNWTMVSLIHILAVTGWDTRSGFFKKEQNDPWLYAIVYKSEQEPLDPRTTKWYDLVEKNLVPETAIASIHRHGYLRQRDLVVPWLDGSLTWMGHQ